MNFDSEPTQRSNTMFVRLLGVLAALASLTATQPVFADLIANASTSWFIDDIDTGGGSGTFMGIGKWRLGTNILRAGNNTDTDGPLGPFPYRAGTFTLAKTILGGSAEATTESKLIIDPMNDNGSFDYELFLTAKAITSGFFDVDPASARAKGRDPQFVDQPGIFSAALVLGSGSSIFEFEDAENGSATARARFVASGPSPVGIYGDVNVDLYSIELGFRNGKVVPNVTFSDLPGLTFTRLGEPITEQEVETLLQSAKGLGTQDGLLSSLDLFTYEYDLTNAIFTSGSAFGSRGNNLARVIPAPGVLALLGLAGLVGTRRRRR